MCFHIKIENSIKEIEKRFNAEYSVEEEFNSQKHINGFSLPQIPVITNEKPTQIQLLYWGLIPHWIKNHDNAQQIRSKTLNARSETITEKPSYKNLINKKHCLVIADGFYEWRLERNKKKKYLIQKDDKKLFAFAGIWDSWRNKDNGEVINSFSIVTQKANSFMSYIHNVKKRQPVILSRADENRWKEMENYKDIIHKSFKVKLSSRAMDSPPPI
tara:strand:+ start:467 stop:1111 length:645 start_codon:yes stop_codon:yes gene_type:complete